MKRLVGTMAMGLLLLGIPTSAQADGVTQTVVFENRMLRITQTVTEYTMEYPLNSGQFFVQHDATFTYQSKLARRYTVRARGSMVLYHCNDGPGMDMPPMQRPFRVWVKKGKPAVYNVTQADYGSDFHVTTKALDY